MKRFTAKGSVVAITGAGDGIGLALARSFVAAGARAVAVCDIDQNAVDAARAKCIAGAPDDARVEIVGAAVDVAEAQAVADFVAQIEQRFGQIDLYCSNAGIMQTDAPGFTALDRSLDDWERGVQVNLMSHVYGYRAALPAMLERGEGAFMITASAAGLLSQIGSTIYATTKHAAVGLAESLGITHGDDGIYVSALCPQAIQTEMLRGLEDSSAAIDGAMPVEELAAHTLASLEAGEFMIRPHATVRDYFKAKADNYDRWVSGMRKLRRMQRDRTGKPI